MPLKTLYTLTFLSILLVTCSPVSAGIRPSFISEESSWRATDIVVVTEEKQIDGDFRVIENWKGGLQPGERIKIPELAEFKEKNARLIHDWPFSETDKDRSPEYVSGDKMILFLRDARKIPAESDDDEKRDTGLNKSATRWKSANPMGSEMRYSTVWIEKGQVYGFIQLINPGPSLLCKVGITETKLNAEVSRVTSTQNALNGALAITDPANRAASLEPFTNDAIFLAREKAFAGLTECGESALPVLRRILSNGQLSEIHGDVIKVFAKAGGKTVGPELTDWVERELEFWKRTAPTLQNGWRSGKGFGTDQMDAIKAVEPLVNRMSALSDAIYALGAIRYTVAEGALIELSDYWRSLPQLYGNEVSQACDEVLRDFGANRKEGKHPRVPKYEVSFAGNKVFSSQLLTAKTSEYAAAYDQLQEDYERDLGGGNLDYALDRLLKFISSQGYLNVEFKSGKQTTERGEFISVDISEGKQYRLGTIKIEGAKLFSPEHIRSMLPLREGDIADGEAIHKWLYGDLQKSYFDLGYLHYDVLDDHQSRANYGQEDAEVADFTITVKEGPQYKVASIKFEGKASVPEDQLRGAMLLRKGETFTQKGLNDSIARLNKLGLTLDKNDVDVSPDPERDLVNLVIFLNKDRRAKESFQRFMMERYEE